MADDWAKRKEEEHDWQSRNTDSTENNFRSSGSAGNNQPRLAKVLSAYDMAMDILGWDKPLSKIVSDYQASVNAKYHDDHIKERIAERVSVLMKRNIMAKGKTGDDFYA